MASLFSVPTWPNIEVELEDFEELKNETKWLTESDLFLPVSFSSFFGIKLTFGRYKFKKYSIMT